MKDIILEYFHGGELPCGCCYELDYYNIIINGETESIIDDYDPRYPISIKFSDKVDCYQHILDKYNIDYPDLDEYEFNSDDYDEYENFLEQILVKNNFNIIEQDGDY